MGKRAMKTAMKAMKRKAKRVSKVARGRGAKARVFRGSKARTSGGLRKSSLIKNKHGRVVSKKAHAHGKNTETLPNLQTQLKQHVKHLESKDLYQLEVKHQEDKHYSRRHEVSTRNKCILMIFHYA